MKKSVLIGHQAKSTTKTWELMRKKKKWKAKKWMRKPCRHSTFSSKCKWLPSNSSRCLLKREADRQARRRSPKEPSQLVKRRVLVNPISSNKFQTMKMLTLTF